MSGIRNLMFHFSQIWFHFLWFIVVALKVYYHFLLPKNLGKLKVLRLCSFEKIEEVIFSVIKVNMCLVFSLKWNVLYSRICQSWSVSVSRVELLIGLNLETLKKGEQYSKYGNIFKCLDQYI